MITVTVRVGVQGNRSAIIKDGGTVRDALAAVDASPTEGAKTQITIFGSEVGLDQPLVDGDKITIMEKMSGGIA